jgi:hypothetical protein
MQRFSDAEAERRRIKKRQQKRYKEQRERGATTTNRPGFGLKLDGVERGRRQVIADPDTAPIVQEVDRKILAGESQRKVLEWLRTRAPSAWKSRRGLQLALLDLPDLDNEGRLTGGDLYVKTGVRTPETQSALRELHGSRRQVYGSDRKSEAATPFPGPGEDWTAEQIDELLSGNESTHYHALAGLVACGPCVDAGFEPKHALMHGRYISRNPKPHSLACEGRRARPGKTDQEVVHGKSFWVSSHLVRWLIHEKLLKVSRDRTVVEAVLKRWAKAPTTTKTAALRRTLEARLAALEEQDKGVTARVKAAITLMSSERLGVVAEAERELEEANADRLVIRADQGKIRAELTALPVPRTRSVEVDQISRLRTNAEFFVSGQRLSDDGRSLVNVDDRVALKGWVDAIGPPILRRIYRPVRKKPRLDLEWRFLDRIRGAPAPDYEFRYSDHLTHEDAKYAYDKGWLNAQGDLTAAGLEYIKKRQRRWPGGARERDPDRDSGTFGKLVKKVPIPPKVGPRRRRP